jgi:hypothetical protein
MGSELRAPSVRTAQRARPTIPFARQGHGAQQPVKQRRAVVDHVPRDLLGMHPVRPVKLLPAIYVRLVLWCHLWVRHLAILVLLEATLPRLAYPFALSALREATVILLVHPRMRRASPVLLAATLK